MSHLHIPDGVLPWWVWGSGLAIALVLLALGARSRREESGLDIAVRGALGGLVLAAMAIELPLGPVEYHLCLLGPVGVLLGATGAFQVMFAVSAILAFAGHGGFTVVGLNALVLGAGAAIARPLYSSLSSKLAPGPAMALSSAGAQALSGLAWLAVVAVALRFGVAATPERVGMIGALSLPLWLLGIAVEAAVGYGLARFLARVRPDLLPAPRSAQVEAA
jgi:cobalt/nickel transport system permease protein